MDWAVQCTSATNSVSFLGLEESAMLSDHKGLWLEIPSSVKSPWKGRLKNPWHSIPFNSIPLHYIALHCIALH